MITDIKKVVIGGVGLLGGSLGLRVKEVHKQMEVVGFGRRESTLQAAVERGAIDSFTTDPETAVKDADLVVLASPVMIIPDMMSNIADFLKPGSIVTDVGSTKVWIQDEAQKRLPANVRFVRSHPMTGSEKSGIEAAQSNPFEQSVTVVTPASNSDEDAIATVRAFWESVGSITITITAQSHDRLVASVSHLPHLLASALVNTVAPRAQVEPRTWDLAAGGFRDTTRIASSMPQIWRDICLTNKDAIITVLGELESELSRFRQALESADGDRIEELFATASESRNSIPPKGRGMLPGIYDLYVRLTDRPGEISEVTGVLGEKNLNIIDIEITRLRDGRSVEPLRLFFNTEDDRDAALEALAEEGIAAELPA
ncbi:MAG: prephenate dehydrogenase [Candidatus Lindowbacteria bacterium]|nr:prephenate dehydrogenase [Candidatus Lindowbacteria bacterium]